MWTTTLGELTRAWLLAIANVNPHGLRRVVTLTDTGQTWYAVLHKRRDGLAM